MGTEVNWQPGGSYQPDSDAVMNFRRALCGQKPYCLLMNTDFSKLDHGRVERFFQRCLFYGIWPGFFDEAAASKDPYWASAKKYYERDRDLFQKYIPLLRAVTAAGWQPVTLATSANPALFVERFGPGPTGELLFTVLNPSSEAQSGGLVADWNVLGLPGKGEAIELISGKRQGVGASEWKVSLSPGETQVWRFDQ
jgi:hypothetical protein